MPRSRDRSRSQSSTRSEDDLDGSESPEPVELLVAGREKRSTAGNRLRGLLDVEESLAEDDDVNGIFAETDDDTDFASSEEELEEDEEGEEGEVEEEVEIVDDEEEGSGREGSGEHMTFRGQPSLEKAIGKKIKQPETDKVDDDMFSDSSDSSDEGPRSADESDAGEKELMRQEKLNRARIRKRQEQRMVGFTTKKGKSAERIGGESLKDEQLARKREKTTKVSAFQAPEVVRSSTRAHTVKNKTYVLQRLQEQEKRKASNAVHHQPRAKELLTQDERIQRAKLIEEHNVASLNHFFEQEVIRKKDQRAAMFALRRIELGPFVRWQSVQVNLPVDQKRLIVEEIEHNEKPDGRKRAWRRHVGEHDEAKAEGARPEKRKYTKRAKLDFTASAAEVPGKNENATSRGLNVQTKSTNGHTAVPEPPEQFQILRPNDVGVRDIVTPDVDDDRTNREDSQQTEIQDFGSVGRMSSPTKVTEPLQLKPSTTTDGESKSQDGAQPAAKPKDADSQHITNEHCISIDGSANEAHPALKVENDNDNGLKAIVKNSTMDQRIVEDVSTSGLVAGDSNNPDVMESEPENSALDETLPTVDTKRESLPAVDKVPFSTELVSLMDFPPDQKLDASTVRLALLGSQASSGRPPQRAKRHLCPISGKAVRFKDPVTGVCYSSLESFRIIRKVLSGEMPWNSAFGEGMYYGTDDATAEWLVQQPEENDAASANVITD
ncbi:YL1 nuclear protein-domain-containing protein [Lipomyces orientalis]|uniref:YL1 nuclear protein-domain-containing protein n=1 Tax=Lipomyces orientalis TaxID=1233043 RepID=A0ACC3TDG9_9ASCO